MDINLTALNSTQGFRIIGEINGDQSGRSVSGAGDVNHDGYDDVIIGAWAAASEAGKSYVIFGKASAFSDINLSALNNTVGFRILGESESESGYSVSGAGDVNHDGYADVIVGAYNALSEAGKSYVIFGKNNSFSDLSLSTLSSNQGFRILGETSGDESSISVSGAGDVNHDGYTDLIIGAPLATDAAGKSYVIFGKASGFNDINLSSLNSTTGFRILGEASGDESGTSVSGAGDVNHDGFADVIVGAPYASSYGGKSYVIFGKNNSFSDISLSTLSSSQGFRILGETFDESSGWSVSSAGDVNGDGFADLIVGAPYASSNAGKSYVIFGMASGFSDISLSSLNSTTGFRILGESSGDISGLSVSGAGDVNHDGFADVVIGAPYATSQAGKSYVVFGKASGFSDISLSSLNSTQGFKIIGESIYDYSGFSVSSAGDVNGDGYADIIIGASQNYPSSGTGKSYVIFGSSSTAESSSTSMPSSSSSSGNILTSSTGSSGISSGGSSFTAESSSTGMLSSSSSSGNILSFSTWSSSGISGTAGSSSTANKASSTMQSSTASIESLSSTTEGSTGTNSSSGTVIIPNENTSSSNLNAVIGGVLGGVLGLLVIAGISYVIYRYCNIKHVPLAVQKATDSLTMLYVEGHADSGIELQAQPPAQVISAPLVEIATPAAGITDLI